MKKFILNFGGFVLLYVLLNHIGKAVIPHKSNMTLYEFKLADIENHEDLNTFFFGSSIIYRQIIPSMFDSLSCKNTNSYNIAIPAMFTPQLLDLYEDILHKDIISPGSTVFLELQNTNAIANNNLYTERSLFKINRQTLALAIGSLPYSTADFRLKVNTVKNYVLSYLYEKMALIHLKRKIITAIKQIPLRKLIKEMETKYMVEKNYFFKERGYQSFAEALKNDPSLNARKKKFQKDYKGQKKIKKNIEKTNFLIPDNKVVKPLIQRLESLTQQSNSKDIEVVIILPSYATTFNHGLSKTYDAIEFTNKISLQDWKKHPEFYKVANRFDENHLNGKGAKLFTEKIALRYNEIVDCE